MTPPAEGGEAHARLNAMRVFSGKSLTGPDFSAAAGKT